MKKNDAKLSVKEIKSMYGSTIDGAPSVYCGTYGKYNEGSLFGMWLDISKFNDYNEFISVCRQLHADEDDPEFMFQDYECFPRAWYCECGMSEETFNKILEYAKLDDQEREAYDDYMEWRNEGDIDDFRDSLEGHWDTEEDFAEYIIEGCYDTSSMGQLQYYIDYGRFARDLFMTDYYQGSNGYVFRR